VDVAEDVGVAPHQLAPDALHHVGEAELVALDGDLRVKEDLQ
jgi:hypothetical protein